MKKILVLGGGSLGSEIIYYFSSEYMSTCIDHGKNFEMMLKKVPSIKIIKDDITNFKLVKKEAENSNIIFYCVDTGGVMSCIRNTKKYYDINVTNFTKLLNSLTGTKVHFFLFSSIFVYPDIPTVTEETKCKPETLYGKFRLEQEQILMDHKFDYTILRLANIFGYGHFFNIGNLGAIEKFIKCVFDEKEIILDGDGSQMVDYVFKNDLMLLLEKLVKKLTNKQIYNVSTGLVRPISEVANIIGDIAFRKFGKSVKIVKSDNNTKLPNLPKVLPTKLMNEISWRPTSDMYSQINKMMDAYNLQHKRQI